MAKRARTLSRNQKNHKSIDWDDPEILWFAGEDPPSEGTIQQHSLLDVAGHLFGKKKEDVEAEWRKIVDQISSFIDTAVPTMKDFTLDEVTFQLGFSAEGHIVFIAKGGVKASISAKFKRK